MALNHIILLFMLLAITLSGCVRAPVETRITLAWEARRDELMRVKEWDIKGRIAVRADNESGSGSLYWTQQKDGYHVRVITSFGRGVYELTGDSNAALLRTPENRVAQAEDAETLFQQQAGWRLPVSGLVYWIRGIPAPALQVDELLLDEENRLSVLNQAGWSIRYKNYMGINGKSMPGRLDLQNNRIRVRVSIREWNLP